MALGEYSSLFLHLFHHAFLYAFEDEVNNLTDAHQDADNGGDHHEEGEDLLLSRARYVAVDHVGAWRQGALDDLGQVVSIIDMIQDVKEAGVKAYLENQAHL